MKLWIIGAKGLLGSKLIHLCAERGIETIATGREVDITHIEQLKKFSHCRLAQGITHIINCAAYTDVDGAEKEHQAANAINALGPENIATVAKSLDVRFMHISTDYVFGEGGKRPFVETDPCNPIGVYAQTKWKGEQNVLEIYPSATIVRSSWLFGKGGKNFISSLVHRMNSDPSLKVVDDQRGKPTFVGDLAEAILSLLCHSGIYHFANEGAVSRFEIALSIQKELLERGVAIKCREILPVPSSTFPTPAKRPSYSVLNTHKISGILGATPRHWEKTLKEYFDESL